MQNKILIELIVPEIDEIFDIYIPINRKIGNVIVLLNKSLFELTNGVYQGTDKSMLYGRETGEMYSINSLVRETNIKSGSCIVLL
jgi:hypothetical protein